MNKQDLETFVKLYKTSHYVSPAKRLCHNVFASECNERSNLISIAIYSDCHPGSVSGAGFARGGLAMTIVGVLS